MRRATPLLLAPLAAVLLAAPARAAFIGSASDPALTGAVIHNLDNQPDGLRFQRAVVDGVLTLSTTSGQLLFDDAWTANFGTTGISLQTRYLTGGDDFRIDFATPVRAFGMNVNALDINWILETYDASGNLLGSYRIRRQRPRGSNLRRGYAGAVEAGPIASARIHGSGRHDWALIDNIAVVAVPEPRSVLLMAVGTLGLAVAGRRRGAL